MLFLLSCSNGENTTTITEEKTISDEAILSNIEDLKKSNTIDKEKVDELLANIDSFVVQAPLNEKVPIYLEMKAKYLAAMGKNKEALVVYDDIYSNYKDYENRPDALFMIAFIYETNIGDKEKAKQMYKRFIDEFPEDEFAKDAKFSIENMDKTPEELMDMFNKNNSEN